MPRLAFGTWIVSLVAVLLLSGCSALLPGQPEFRGTVLEPARPAPDFTLTTQDETTYRLSDRQGQIVLLFFGYTFCPDVCPTMLAQFKRIHDALGTDAELVDFVFISVDPERDTPARLKKHLRILDPSFIGLTGDEGTLEPVWKAYGVYRAKTEIIGNAIGYLMEHTAAMYLIDRDGNLRLTYSFGTADEDIVYDIRELLEPE